MFLVAAFVGFAIVGLALMVDPPAASQAVAPAAASPRAADAGRQPAPATAETTDLTRDGWIGATQPRWARDGSRTISFKLEAEHDVAVWMKRVRPSLAVRCLSRKTEVFVITDSPASVEPTDRHTVHFSFDEGRSEEHTSELQ